jgi:hypothetical protein
VTRSKDELIDGLQHFNYEVWMVASCAGALGSDLPPFLQNAALESMLIHIRSLTDFLVRKPGKYHDDMIRTNFASEWTPKPEAAAERLLQDYETANKHLAHLTWARVQPAPTQWNPHDLVVAVIAVADAWSWHVAHENPGLGTDVRIAVAAAIKSLGIDKAVLGRRDPVNIEVELDDPISAE